MRCGNAIFAVRNIINYFNERSSSVFMARVVSSEISGNFRRNFSGNFRKNNGTFPE